MTKLDPSSLTRGKDEQQIALSYRGGPLAPSTAQHTATLHVGDRAPDAAVHDDQGASLRLFDLYRGPHFTALAIGGDAAGELAELAWPDRGAALRRITVDAPSRLDDNTVNLRDTAGNVRKAYGTNSDTLILIRPDGYIASIATRDGSCAVTAAAATALTPPAHKPTIRRTVS
jgi:hypothetical protein